MNRWRGKNEEDKCLIFQSDDRQILIVWSENVMRVRIQITQVEQNNVMEIFKRHAIDAVGVICPHFNYNITNIDLGVVILFNLRVITPVIVRFLSGWRFFLMIPLKLIKNRNHFFQDHRVMSKKTAKKILNFPFVSGNDIKQSRSGCLFSHWFQL